MVRALTMVMAFSFFAGVAHAEPTAEEKAACEADYKKYCSIVPEEKTHLIVECLKQNASKISDQCRKQLEKK